MKWRHFTIYLEVLAALWVNSRSDEEKEDTDLQQRGRCCLAHPRTVPAGFVGCILTLVGPLSLEPQCYLTQNEGRGIHGLVHSSACGGSEESDQASLGG